MARPSSSRALPRSVAFGTLALLGLVLAATLPALAGGADATTVPETTTTVDTTTLPPEPVVPVGVTIGQVAVEGLTRDAAIAAVQTAYLETPVIVRTAGVVRSLAARWLVITAPGIDQAVDRALARTAPGDVAIRVSYSRARVRLAATQIAYKAFRRARDARWKWRRHRPVAVREHAGRRVDERAAGRLIGAAILSPARRIAVPIPTLAIAPSVDREHLPPAVVIIRSSKRLRLYRFFGDRAHFIRWFGVATGQSAYPTPRGRFRIVEKQRDPWWIPPDSDWAKGKKPIPPGPGNPQ